MPVSAARRTDENTLELEYLPNHGAILKREATGEKRDKMLQPLLTGYRFTQRRAASPVTNNLGFIYQPRGRFVGVILMEEYTTDADPCVHTELPQVYVLHSRWPNISAPCLRTCSFWKKKKVLSGQASGSGAGPKQEVAGENISAE